MMAAVGRVTAALDNEILAQIRRVAGPRGGVELP
jgi:hypothetical protein